MMSDEEDLKTETACGSDKDFWPKSVPEENENDTKVSDERCSGIYGNGHAQIIIPTPEGTSNIRVSFH